MTLEGRVLALDVDGVLLDPGRGGRGGWQEELAARFSVDAGELDPVFFQSAWPEVILGRRPIVPALAQAIEDLGWTMTVEDLLGCWFEADFVVDGDVVEAARTWAADGARLVLVTNQEHRRARFLGDRLGALMPIEGLVYSAAVGVMKSDPAFFPIASDRLGIDGDGTKVVFVDDSADNVEAARRHGGTAVHFRRTSDWRTEVSAALSRGE
jgi:putative hydrolase of the HAD superfamily